MGEEGDDDDNDDDVDVDKDDDVVMTIRKTGANVDKYKKVGTGLGAVAGYWASGRKKQ